MTCPQCGFDSDEFREGVCADCCSENQRRLNEHNAQYDFWEKCIDEEKDRYIKSAMR